MAHNNNILDYDSELRVVFKSHDARVCMVSGCWGNGVKSGDFCADSKLLEGHRWVGWGRRRSRDDNGTGLLLGLGKTPEGLGFTSVSFLLLPQSSSRLS
ncbi:hypothetical protein L1987_46569 [Smallanthus sonchifolius]|uniref:Uncharacterized protein n=1 Tax=Smallanthus sonchifolius TaxID=185202 RepID=A0ACB9G055_9ASTR|nr:hypothetical protein L1987_46569 [Smallanthus sonchifolius]